MPTIAIWTIADFGATGLGDLVAGTFTVNGTFETASFTDDDPDFEDFFGGGGQIQDPGLNQDLTSDLILDGVTVGVVGDQIYNAAEGDIVNNTTGEVGQVIYVTINGGTAAEFVGVSSTIAINPGDSVTTSNLNFIGSEPFDNIVCFTPGTMIDTRDGPVMIDDLEVGDFVMTDDHGAQPIRKIVRRSFTAEALARKPQLVPVRIKRNALAPNVPHADLVVSPQHRMVLRGWQALLMFGSPDVLATALSMVDEQDICRDWDSMFVTYIHLIFDRHEIITANGALTESLYPGKTAQKAFTAAGLAELHEIFPQLQNTEEAEITAARPILKAFEAKALMPRGPHQ